MPATQQEKDQGRKVSVDRNRHHRLVPQGVVGTTPPYEQNNLEDGTPEMLEKKIAVKVVLKQTRWRNAAIMKE